MRKISILLLVLGYIACTALFFAPLIQGIVTGNIVMSNMLIGLGITTAFLIPGYYLKEKSKDKSNGIIQ